MTKYIYKPTADIIYNTIMCGFFLKIRKGIVNSNLELYVKFKIVFIVFE